MRLGKAIPPQGEARVFFTEGESARLLTTASITEILHHPEPVQAARSLLDAEAEPVPLSDLRLAPPLDEQEVWAAGVTYIRSKEARERESEGAAVFYDAVYDAPRPELFFKAPAYRVVAPGDPVRARRDSRWSVPEPEIALVISPEMKIVGYTIGNDMSARDIEGENPLYLPQAKSYDGACAVGPLVTLPHAMPSPEEMRITLTIMREGETVFEGFTGAKSLKRSFEELVDWLGRETTFPRGAVLLTGTGIVPEDDFTLREGDRVRIELAGVGNLENPVTLRLLDQASAEAPA